MTGELVVSAPMKKGTTAAIMSPEVTGEGTAPETPGEGSVSAGATVSSSRDLVQQAFGLPTCGVGDPKPGPPLLGEQPHYEGRDREIFQNPTPCFFPVTC